MITLDIETNIDNNGNFTRIPTVVSTVDVNTRRINQYSPDTITELVYMLPYLGTIITFNGDSFDIPILSQYTSRPLKDSVQSFDLYRDLARNTNNKAIKLDDLALGTLGRALPQHGENLAQLGQIKQLWKRSTNGAIELAQIYNFGVTNRYVRVNRQGITKEIAVNWTLTI